MDQQASVELLLNMLEIYSPSGKEEKITSFLAESMKKLGFQHVRTDRAGNVYGEIGSGSPAILLCGHMDTVPKRLTVKTENGRLYGRGAVDAKSSLAAMVSAAHNLQSVIENGKVIVAGVVEEERRAKGIRQLMHEGLRVNYAIFGEPSGAKNITFAYKGKVDLRFVCKTASGHVGAQHLLDNVIEKAYELWAKLKDSCEKNRSRYGIFYSLTPSLVAIKSQRSSGGIPDTCVINVDLRLPPTIKSDAAVSIAKKSVEDFQATRLGTSVSMKVIDRVEPFISDRNSSLMKALEKAILEVTSEPAKFLRKTGTGDMNIFGAETGIHVATYGPGDAHLSHTENEWVELSEYKTSIKVYERTVENIISQCQTQDAQENRNQR
jgi:LysW-gamma-L-lysine carboxypeptidase